MSDKPNDDLSNKAIVDHTIPSNCFILEETGATKKETTLVFEFLNL